ncbi:hypothetical protein ACFL0P_02650 [Candidatus Omnitrophota bacterium]
MHHRFENDNKGRGLIETIFSILILLGISGIFIKYGIINLKEAQEVALENQLTNIKTSVELYKALEGHYPEDLRELNKECKVIKEDSLYDKEYLEFQTLDKEGYPICPNGHRFIYNNKTGEVKRRMR